MSSRLPLCVYVGAHRGAGVARVLAAAPDQAYRVVAFEPSPDALRHLEARFRSHPRIEIVPAAVVPDAQATPVVTLFRFTPDGGSDSLAPAVTQSVADTLAPAYPDGAAHFAPRGSLAVPAVDLPSELRRFGAERVGLDMLILDAQGVDLSIVRSLRSMLARGLIRRIVAEVDRDGLPHYTGFDPALRIGGNSLAEWREFMAGLPYEPDALVTDLETGTTFDPMTEAWPLSCGVPSIQCDIGWTATTYQP